MVSWGEKHLMAKGGIQTVVGAACNSGLKLFYDGLEMFTVFWLGLTDWCNHEYGFRFNILLDHVLHKSFNIMMSMI